MTEQDINRKLAWASFLLAISLLIFVLDRLTGCSVQDPEAKPVTIVPTASPTASPPPIKDPLDNFLGVDEVESLILKDLSQPQLNKADRENFRYLVMSDIKNEGRTTEKPIQAMNKTINSLSSQRQLMPGFMIDPDNTIMRIDLRDYFAGGGRAVWQRFEQDAVIKIVSQTIRGRTIQFLAQSAQPWAHASIFAETMLTKNTYYDIVGIPPNISLFYANFAKVIPQNEFDAQNRGLTLVGSQNSLISENNRLLQRLTAANGGVWQTFDVDKNNLGAAQNLFENPFPVEVNPLAAPQPNQPQQRIVKTNRIFKHAASEVIGFLPNGMLAFGLFNAGGGRENAAPQTVVSNSRAVGIGLSSEIQNARDCFACHSAGFIPLADELSAHIKGAPNFNEVEKRLGQELFRPQNEVDKLMILDNQKFLESLVELEIDSDSDPINIALLDPIRSGVSPKEAASFFFLKEEEFIQRLRSVATAQAEVGTLIRGGSISFQQFINSAPQIIKDLNLFQDIR